MNLINSDLWTLKPIVQPPKNIITLRRWLCYMSFPSLCKCNPDLHFLWNLTTCVNLSNLIFFTTYFVLPFYEIFVLLFCKTFVLESRLSDTNHAESCIIPFNLFSIFERVNRNFPTHLKF